MSSLVLHNKIVATVSSVVSAFLLRFVEFTIPEKFISALTEEQKWDSMSLAILVGHSSG